MTSWRSWIHGLVSAFVGGAAASITAGVIAPESFNTTNGGLQKLGLLMLVSGFVTAAAYLKQSPIPPQ